jgi:hypothetical protein
MDQSWISAAWQAVGGGRIVDIRLVDIHRIAPYLSKYLTKEFLTFAMKPRQRRDSTSRDIVLFVKQTSGIWTMLRVRLDYLFWKAGPMIREEREDDGMLLGFITDKPVMS